jgi:hypothetical protein
MKVEGADNGRNLRIKVGDGPDAWVYDFGSGFTNGQAPTRSRIHVRQISDYICTC